MVGIVNTFFYKGFGFNFNLDVRKGGDVFNGNEMFLFRQGLSARGLDRTVPYIFKGVLRDGAENGEKPTTNTIQVTPQTRSGLLHRFFRRRLCRTRHQLVAYPRRDIELYFP